MIDGSKHIRELFESEPNRVTDLTFAGSGLTIDISRQRINSTILNKLVSLADDRGLANARQAMFSGEAINNTENRSVLHTALRRPKNDSLVVNGVDVVSDVHSVLESMGKLAQKVRSGSWLGATGKPIKHVVNIGIGGSDLGPVMAYEALKPYSDRSISFHFVSNVDGADLFEVLNQVSLEQTLFIVASKTFTTQETMLNATSARN
ncbi:MAG: putative glucose-6-phosphate isomerase, partial [Actinomycetota bacterium]